MPWRFHTLLYLALALSAQPRVTIADYLRAERLFGYNIAAPVFNGPVKPAWLAGDRFWYRSMAPDGVRFLVYDPSLATSAPAFDQSRLLAALSSAMGRRIHPLLPPFAEFVQDGNTISFRAGPQYWSCDIAADKCAIAANPRAPSPNEVLSPDKSSAAFIRDFNLWTRDMATGKETRLTTDGVQDFGYATDNAGWTRSDRPVILWSPDSKRIATFQQDQRGVGEMYLVEGRTGHPVLQAWKYPLPGDAIVPTIQRLVIDLNGPRVIRLKMAADQHRSTVCDHIVCADEWTDVQWSADSTQLAFVSTSRDHKREQFRVADAATGAIREVFEETSSTFFESGTVRANWRYLPASHEVIWFSERDDWGQLYLYDLDTGRLKNPITTGQGNVTELLRVDEKNRLLYFLGVGREKDRDPYFTHFYRVGFDGKNLALLTPEDANHEIVLAPSGRYFVDNYSKPDTASTSMLRDSDGKLISTLASADTSRLSAAGWKPPMPIIVKARDGATDLYGLLYRPSNFDASRKYPIIDHIYPGPQKGSVGSRSFAAARGDQQAIAELGFVVVEIDGLGTPGRSKKFHAAYYGDLADNTLADQVTGIEQLAKRFPWMDIQRVGIYGHSGGGYAAAAALLRFPDFFTVGVSEAGNHDNRVFEDDWGEKWQGILNGSNYDSQATQNLAKNLKGHLLLAHGTLDNNVPPNNTLLLVDALIKANKDFDLLLLPNRTHGFGYEPYMIRRRWDYFVRYLLGAEPPQGYELRFPGQ